MLLGALNDEISLFFAVETCFSSFGILATQCGMRIGHWGIDGILV
jgi:hypothetical protein